MADKYEEDVDELFPPPSMDTDYSHVIILDGLPIIPREKEEKLTTVLKKILQQFGTVVSMLMPFGGDSSHGYAFVEFSNHEQAKSAVEKLNNYKLDKSHVFKTNMYDDFEIYDKMPTVYKPTEYKYERSEDLYSWLLEPRGCDQFVLRYGKETEVMWYTNPPSSVWKQTMTTDQFAMWSPKGTYFVVFHPNGIILVGGPEWKKLKRIAHPGVENVQFSPGESFLVTYSPVFNKDAQPSDDKDPHTIIIWDMKTGRKLRAFPKLKKNWPEFSWSQDEKYFSRVDNGFIYIYETPHMKLLEVEGVRKPVKLHGRTVDHAWSPVDNILCAYVPEHDSIPARVVLKEIPSLKTVGDRALYNVDNCVILWQDRGDYLAVKVDRHGKTKKKLYTAFEFFRIREKDIPVEDMKLQDTVLAFAWEPKGHRFAILHGEGEGGLRSVSFHSMLGTKITKLDVLEKRAVTHITWSPRGRFVVLLNVESTTTMEFYDVETKETLAKEQKHLLGKMWSWDPTGRYFVTFVSGWREKTELGFKVWSFRGVELWSVLKEGFLQFEWRPRPPTLLDTEQLKELNEKSEFFKRFRQKYKQEDKLRMEEMSQELERKKEMLKQEYRDFFRRKRGEWEDDAEWRRNMGIEDEGEYILVEEEVEEVLDMKEEVIEY